MEVAFRWRCCCPLLQAILLVWLGLLCCFILYLKFGSGTILVFICFCANTDNLNLPDYLCFWSSLNLWEWLTLSCSTRQADGKQTYIHVISRGYQHWILELSWRQACWFWLQYLSIQINRVILVSFKRGVFISIIIFAFITRFSWFLVLFFALPVVMVLIFLDLVLNVRIPFSQQYIHFLHFVFSVHIYSSWPFVLNYAI